MTPWPRPDKFSPIDFPAPAQDGRVARPRLSIIVPTYCEAENAGPTIAAIEAALPGISWEIIFVDDDSPDGTVETIRKFGERDGRVRRMPRTVLRAETAAHVILDDAHLRELETERVGDVAARVEHALRRFPDRDLIAAPLGDSAVWLERGV